MGGIGSGRRCRGGGKLTTEGLHALDVRFLARKGILTSGGSLTLQWTSKGKRDGSVNVLAYPADSFVILRYRWRSGESWQDEEYPVLLTQTPCLFGGYRFWFICPVRGCGNRAAILYGGGKVFACRHCLRAVYQSQNETATHRTLRKAEKIRERLGWEPGIGSPWGEKPKWMHSRTFLLLMRELEKCLLSWSQDISGLWGMTITGSTDTPDG